MDQPDQPVLIVPWEDPSALEMVRTEQTLWWWEKRLAETRFVLDARSLVRVVVC